MGDRKFLDGPLMEVRKHYSITKMEKPPMKFLGGVLKETDDNELVIDYNHHVEKLKHVPI